MWKIGSIKTILNNVEVSRLLDLTIQERPINVERSGPGSRKQNPGTFGKVKTMQMICMRSSSKL